jgi:hypothetical protein
VLLAGVLALIAQRPVLGQASNGNSTTQPGASNVQGAQTAPNSNSPNQNQPLSVNPLTGIATVSALHYQPLTGEERWKLYWKQNYWSVGAYFGPVLTALVVDQASNTPSEWGGGFKGFGHRLGSQILSGIAQGTFQAALAPALHEDVRYVASADKGFRRRALHAVAFSFLTYNNQGHTTLNISNLTSFYAATALTTTWIPTGETAARYTLINATEQIGLSVPVNIFQEFWPEIRHKVFRRP